MEHDRDKLKHLLIIMLEALSADPEQGRAPGRFIRERFREDGIEEEDLHDLLAWLASHLGEDDRADWTREPAPDAPSAKAFRFFGPEDERYLTPGGMGYLVTLLNDHQIDRAQFEALLAYAAVVAYRPMDAWDLEPVIEQVIFRPGRPGMTGGASEGQENIH